MKMKHPNAYYFVGQFLLCWIGQSTAEHLKYPMIEVSPLNMANRCKIGGELEKSVRFAVNAIKKFTSFDARKRGRFGC